jgi:hypothetical protein
LFHNYRQNCFIAEVPMRVSLGCTFCALLMLLAFGTAFGQDTNFASGPQYLLNSDPTNHASPLFARSISTPTLSLSGPPLGVGTSNATEGLVAGADNGTSSPQPAPAPDLLPIFYGPRPVSVIEVSFSESEVSSTQLPPSILDAGVWLVTSTQALREQGYGLTLAEAAAHGKSQNRHATRVYTNADVERLHGGS